MAALLKLTEIEKLLKMGAFLIKEGLFNEWMSEAQKVRGMQLRKF
jgi:hypothetical protein